MKQDIIGVSIIALILIVIFAHYWQVSDRMMKCDTTQAAHCN